MISGNGDAGVRISGRNGVASSGNRVQGNRIGTGAGGTIALGNAGDGVRVDPGSANDTVGGTDAGSGNAIAFNRGGGVVIIADPGNSVLGNAIRSNAGLGIDLGGDGPTANDPGDADTGANHLQNFPVLTAAEGGVGSAIVRGTLNSIPATRFRVEFFASAADDPNGRGEMYLGSTDAVTDAAGEASFVSTPAGPVAVGRYITATATGPTGDSSEFSRAVRVGPPVAPDLVVVGIVAPATAQPGQVVTVTWNDVNQGNGPAIGRWTDEVLLATAPDGSGAVSLGILDFVGTLDTAASGASPLSRSLRVTLPSAVTIPAGRASVAFDIVATQDSLAEKDEAVTISVSAPGYPDGRATLQVTDDDLPTLSMTWPTTTVSEGRADGITVTVGRAFATDQPLRVRLESSDLSVSTVPSDVTIPANAASVTFAVRPVDNSTVDGVRTAVIAAYGTYASCGCKIQVGTARGTVRVLDDDSASLRVVIDPGRAAEGIAHAATATVTRNTPPDADLIVFLTSSDTTEATVPARMTIPAGQRSASFFISTVADGRADGDQVATVTAVSPGLAPGSDILTVLDIDLPDLQVRLNPTPVAGYGGDALTVGWAVSNGGLAPATGVWVDRVYLSRDLQAGADDLVVAEVPFAGTLGIGSSYTRSATFTLPESLGDFYLIVVTDASGTLVEGSEANNAPSPPPRLAVQPAYTATVAAEISTAVNGTPIRLHGRAVNVAGGQPAANKPVAVRVLVDGTRRIINARTDAYGNYEATFRPLPLEAGRYSVAAAHPGVSDDAIQARFTLVGIDAGPARPSVQLVPGLGKSGQITITNLSDLPLTGLKASAVNLPAGVNLRLDLPEALAGRASVTLNYTLTAGPTAGSRGRFEIRLSSAEGATLGIPVAVEVVPLTPRLTGPARLDSGMLRATQTLVDFTISNDGGVGTGVLHVLIPDAPWLSVASGVTIPSLAPGQSTKVSLLLNPAAGLPLGPYDGSIVVVGDDSNAVTVPFTFRAVSAAKGDLKIAVVDESTYYVAGSPKLAGATVTLLDVFTRAAVATAKTGADGIATFSNLPEGSYDFEVRAAKHNVNQATARIAPGQTEELTVFVSSQLVTYNWKVVAVPFTDRYSIQVDSTFETNVPAAVVTMTPGAIDLATITDGSRQFDFVIANHGLIQAEGVRLLFPTAAESPLWEFKPLIDVIGILPAMSEITVPVIVRRRVAASSAIVGGPAAPNGIKPAAQEDGGPCSIFYGLEGHYECGPAGVPIFASGYAVNAHGNCGVPTVGTSPPFLGTPVSGSGGGAGQKFIFPLLSKPVFTFIAPSPCDPGGTDGGGGGGGGGGDNQGNPDEVCAPGSPFRRLVDETYPEEVFKSLRRNQAQLQPLGDRWLSDYSFLPWANYDQYTITVTPPPGFDVAGFFASWSSDMNSVPVGEGATRFGQINKFSSSDRPRVVGDIINIEIYGILGNLVGWDYGDIMVTQAAQDSFRVATLNRYSLLAPVYEQWNGRHPVSGSREWSYVRNPDKTVTFYTHGMDTPTWFAVQLGKDYQRVDWESFMQGIGERFGLSPSDAKAAVQGFSRSLSRPPDCYIPPNSGGQNGPAARTSNLDGIDRKPDQPRASAVVVKSAATGNDGICAKVSLRLDQEAVLTRTAFAASLEIGNGGDQSVVGLHVYLRMVDARTGKPADGRFSISPVALAGIHADAPDQAGADAGWSIAGGTTGSATWTLLPTDLAAANGPTDYTVVGMMIYRIGDQEYTIPLAPATITVYPDAALSVKYFHRRDVFADDPFTPGIEPSVPYELAVMIQNTGQGAARDLTITSAQPRIVENKKGLLADFKIIGSQVNGEAVAPSLAVNFGTIRPGEIKVGQWLLTSSLQGHFADYSASFRHLTGFGNSRTSLIKDLSIHELVHGVRDARPGADALADFLTNDVADPLDLPDTVYLTDDSTEAVGIGVSTSTTQLDASGLRYRVAIGMPAGFGYAQFASPRGAGFRLDKVIRADGVELPIGPDAWTTDRSFVKDGERPIYEDLVHLFDFDGSSNYTLIYKALDETGPTVAAIGSVTPDPTEAPVVGLTITFSEPIDPASFTLADLTMSRDGVAVPLAGASILRIDPTTYRVEGLSGPTSPDGRYVFTMDARGVADIWGNAGVGSASRSWVKAADAPAVSAVVGLPTGPTNATPGVARITFTRAIDPTSFTLADLDLTRDGVELLSRTGGPIRGLDDPRIVRESPTTFRVEGLDALTNRDGAYVFAVNASGVLDATSGAAGVDKMTVAWTRETVAPIIEALPEIVTNPRNSAVPSVDVTFSEPIDPATFTTADLLMTRDGDPTNLIDPADARFAIRPIGDRTYRISGLNWAQGLQGDYRLTVVAAGIADPAGNAATEGRSLSWTIDLTPPPAPTGLAITPNRRPSPAGGLTNTGEVGFRGILAEAGLSVHLFDATAGTDLGHASVTGTTFDAALTLASGVHRLRVLAVDPASNVSAEGYFTVTVDTTPPAVTALAPVIGPRTSAVSSEDVTFSEPIDLASFALRAFSLTINNDPTNLITDGVTISLVDGTPATYRIDGLGGLTGADGTYTLRVDTARLSDPAGNAGSSSLATTWLMDSRAPVSSVNPLPHRQAGTSFAISVAGSDPLPAPGAAASGAASYDIYVSTDGAAFRPWTTLPAANPAAVFQAASGRSYAFYSVGRDAAGNVEAKAPVMEGSTDVPDLDAPTTLVVAVDGGTPDIVLTATGTDTGGSGLAYIDLDAEVDGGARELVARLPAGPPIGGESIVSATYHARVDGLSHRYRFFSVGIDGDGNLEPAPEDSTLDRVIEAAFSPPVSLELTGFDVQRGARQRSFVRYVGLAFNRPDGLADLIASIDGNDDPADDRIRLTRHALDGSGPGERVSLSRRLEAHDRSLEIDFGTSGLGGDPGSMAGDGYYVMEVDLDGDGVIDLDRRFYRLLGDTRADRMVDNLDLLDITQALGMTGANLEDDVNGDGVVNALDRILAARSRGRRLGAGLRIDT